MRTKNTINYKKKIFIVGVVGFEPTAFLMCGFYRPVPIRHLSSTPIMPLARQPYFLSPRA